MIGSGVGGLSAAALLSRHGDRVTVLESHYHPGGVAHAFDIDGYRFDAGPSLWAGMSKPGTNPLRQILDILGEEVRGFSPGERGTHAKPRAHTSSFFVARLVGEDQALYRGTRGGSSLCSTILYWDRVRSSSRAPPGGEGPSARGGG